VIRKQLGLDFNAKGARTTWYLIWAVNPPEGVHFDLGYT